jgi:hypothetical protein
LTVTPPPRVIDIEGMTVGTNPPTGTAGNFDGLATNPNFPQVTNEQSLVGTKSIKIPDATTFKTCRFQFFNFKETLYARQFLYLPSVPTGFELNSMAILTAAGGGIAKFHILTTGKAQIHTGTNAATGTINVPTNAWFRQEICCTPGVSSELRWWSNPFDGDIDHPTEKLTTINTGAECGGVDYGSAGGNFPTTPFSFYIDKPAYSRDDWVGPDINPFPRAIKPDFAYFSRTTMRV